MADHGEPCRFFRLTDGGASHSNPFGFTRTVLQPMGEDILANQFYQAPNDYQPPVSVDPFDMPTDVFQTDNTLDGLFFRENFESVAIWHYPDFGANYWDGSWDRSASLPIGYACGFMNFGSSPITVAFMGVVLDGPLTVTIPSGWSYVAPKLPKGGRIQSDLGYPATDGDIIEIGLNFDGDTQTYPTQTYYYNGGIWFDAEGSPLDEPMISAGEGFNLYASQPKTWLMQ
jgi:hypothetical protein